MCVGEYQLWQNLNWDNILSISSFETFILKKQKGVTEKPQVGCRRLAWNDPGDSADNPPPFTYLSTTGLNKTQNISRTLKIGFYSYFLRNENVDFQIGKTKVQHKKYLQTHENRVYINTLFMTYTKAFGNGKLYNSAQQESVNFRSYIHHAKYFITFYTSFKRAFTGYRPFLLLCSTHHLQ